MKNFITSAGLLAACLLFTSQGIAQEAKINSNKETTQSVQQISPSDKGKCSNKMTMKTPSEKSKKIKLDMPEKDDQKSKEWRMNGLKKRKLNKKNATPGKKKHDVMDNEDRIFGEYKTWEKRTKETKDEDWARLSEIISNKVNLPQESKSIIAKKRIEIKEDLNANRIDKTTFNQLNNELNYAEKDVQKIQVWVGGKR